MGAFRSACRKRGTRVDKLFFPCCAAWEFLTGTCQSSDRENFTRLALFLVDDCSFFSCLKAKDHDTLDSHDWDKLRRSRPSSRLSSKFKPFGRHQP